LHPRVAINIPKSHTIASVANARGHLHANETCRHGAAVSIGGQRLRRRIPLALGMV
jgi:hypothetical protein